MSKQQLHKRHSNDRVKDILGMYDAGEMKVKQAMKHLGIGRTRFYELVKIYKDDAKDFSLDYDRKGSNNRLDPTIQENILKELKVEKEKIIDNPDVPTKRYNYSYIKNLLETNYEQKVSLPTIINRAKEHGYWKKKPPKRVHDREVLTNYTGELIQHDASYHLWAPDGQKKWYLITSLDDHSRVLLYADFWERESSFAHISALQSVVLTYGVPLKYYADQHSIFRYVKDRDKHSPWREYQKFTDDVDPQWKQVIKECQIEPIYALSPQAKGKIERPYTWMQDHVVRTCVREETKTIDEAREILKKEVRQYNYKRVHSTIGEIPMRRFEQAKRDGKSLFRPFEIPKPYQSAKDIFSLRMVRTVNAYRKISVQNFEMKVSGVPPQQQVELRLYPDMNTGLTEVRFWYKNQFKGSQQVKISDLPLVQF